jgi:benzil reductase ((S)-benzoin forming)
VTHDTPSKRLALVTGTSSGIGAAVATQLLERGWEVIGIARRQARLAHPAYSHLSLDLGDLETLVTTMNLEVAPRLGSSWKRLGLVNNAGTTGKPAPLPRQEPHDLAPVFAVNVIAPIWLMGFFVRHYVDGMALRIVNVSSGVARRPAPGLAAYSSSKAALLSAGTTLAMEWEEATAHAPAPRDVAILSYEPHVVDTGMQQGARSIPPSEFPWVSRFQDYKARGQLVPPEGPAGEITNFLEADRKPRFSELRYRP